MRKALLVVDVQNDFYETGALPVSNASKINDSGKQNNERPHVQGDCCRARTASFESHELCGQPWKRPFYTV
ncbi:hypothetical protein [Mesotoga sp.]|uniref:hypothetical protein n=1 Tax=Mesotoga sp. TaxID=2053577 RepID=UPI00345E35E1